MLERHPVSVLRSSLPRRPRSSSSRRTSRALVVLTLLLAPLVPLGVIGATPAEAAETPSLTTASGGYDKDVYGDFLLAGNGSMRCPTANDPAATTGAPVNGAAVGDCAIAQGRPASGAVPVNDTFDMRWADVDTDTTTYNSSRAALTIPTGSRVDYAQLSWAGNTGRILGSTTVGCSTNQTNRGAAEVPAGTPAAQNVKLTVGTASSSYAPRDYRDDLASVSGNAAEYYSATADVTAALNAAPRNASVPITVGNIWSPQGYNCFAGWSLTVVFAYDAPDATNAPLKRTVQIRNGHVRQFANDPATPISITGLRTVTNSTKVGITAYEGDYGLAGDSLTINGTVIPDPGGAVPTSPNFFTSVSNGATAPAVANNLSVDAKSFTTTAIPSGATTANVVLSTTQDSYMVQSLVLSTPVPDIRATKTAGASIVRAGGTISFSITVSNPTDSDLTGVLVRDAQFPACNRDFTVLKKSAPQTYTCTTTVGTSDFVNTATATGTDFTQTPVTTTASSGGVSVIQPALAATKTADKASYTAGDTITFTVQVKNTGNSPLTNVRVVDPKVPGAAPGCDRTFTTLAAGASITPYTCTTIAGTGLNGSNTINVTGTDGTGAPVTAQSTAPTPLNGSISGRVLADPNADGVPDNASTGITGVTVRLVPAPGNTQSYATPTVTTVSGGAYAFTNVPPGVWRVVEDATPGFQDGADTPGTNATRTAGTNDSFDVTIGTDAQGEPTNSSGNLFTEYPTGSLSGTVYIDRNDDGVQSGAGETGIQGVTLSLTGVDSQGNAVSLTTQTAADGSYAFTGLRASGTNPANGNTGYRIQETQAPGFVDGKETAGTIGGATVGLTNNTGTTAPANDRINAITLPEGGVGTGYRFGELPASSLTGSVQLSTGRVLGGVTVTLSGTDDRGGAVSATTTSDANGTFVFPFLRPSNSAGYTVTETQPAQYGDGSVSAPPGLGDVQQPNTVAGIVLARATDASGIVFVDTAATIDAVVYSDLDGNGLQGLGEPGIPSSPVLVTRTGGTPLSFTPFTVLSDSTGRVLVQGLPEGTYSLTQTEQPTGYQDGREAATVTAGNTSVNETISGIVLARGGTATGYQFGEIQLASLEGTVSVTGAGPLPGVTVRLTGSDDRGPITAVTDGHGRRRRLRLHRSAPWHVRRDRGPARRLHRDRRDRGLRRRHARRRHRHRHHPERRRQRHRLRLHRHGRHPVRLGLRGHRPRRPPGHRRDRHQRSDRRRDPSGWRDHHGHHRRHGRVLLHRPAGGDVLPHRDDARGVRRRARQGRRRRRHPVRHRHDRRHHPGRRAGRPRLPVRRAAVDRGDRARPGPPGPAPGGRDGPPVRHERDRHRRQPDRGLRRQRRLRLPERPAEQRRGLHAEGGPAAPVRRRLRRRDGRPARRARAAGHRHRPGADPR